MKNNKNIYTTAKKIWNIDLKLIKIHLTMSKLEKVRLKMAFKIM